MFKSIDIRNATFRHNFDIGCDLVFVNHVSPTRALFMEVDGFDPMRKPHLFLPYRQYDWNELIMVHNGERFLINY